MKKKVYKRNKKVKLSLIVPIFNEEEYLPKLFDSICKQSVMPDEIVICDNNSTDKSAEIIKSYSKKLPIKYVFEKEKGILAAVRAAYRATCGEIIIRCDADCILPSDWVKNVCKHFEEDESLDALGGKYVFYDAIWWFKILSELSFFASDIYHGLILGRQFLSGGNSAYRKKVIEKLGNFDWKESGVDDQIMYKKLRREKFKFRLFSDCSLFSSCRRYRDNPWEIVLTLVGVFLKDVYNEKSD